MLDIVNIDDKLKFNNFHQKAKEVDETFLCLLKKIGKRVREYNGLIDISKPS